MQLRRRRRLTRVAITRLVVPRGHEIAGDPRSPGSENIGERAHLRLTGLDAVRLAAAALVFGSHAALASGVPASWAIVNAGGVGVALFFVLSGYLIPTLWSRRPDRTYWIRRAARILPAYWLAVIGLGVATGVPLTAATLAMLQPIDLSSFDTFLGVVWTLRIELVFYAAVPALAVLPLRWIGGLAAASFVAWAITSLTGDFQASGLAPFRFWMFLPGLFLARRPPRSALPWSVALLGAALVALAVLRADLVIATAAAGLLVASALSRPWRVPRWIVYGSTISYGVYLWHHEVLRALRDIGLPPVTIVALGIVLTIAAAAASWELLERPVSRLAAGLRRDLPVAQDAAVEAEASRRARLDHVGVEANV